MSVCLKPKNEYENSETKLYISHCYVVVLQQDTELHHFQFGSIQDSVLSMSTGKMKVDIK